MQDSKGRRLPSNRGTNRRQFLKLPLAAPVVAGMPGAVSAAPGAGDEDHKNIKIAHIINWDASDDFLLFCKQIGLRWARLMYHDDPHMDKIHKIQRRFGEYGIRFYAGSHYAYRSLKIQLGQPGRDEDIETYQTYLRSLGKLGIPVAAYDFHPANTYTTGYVERRGYIAREFNLHDFRNK